MYVNEHTFGRCGGFGSNGCQVAVIVKKLIQPHCPMHIVLKAHECKLVDVVKDNQLEHVGNGCQEEAVSSIASMEAGKS